MSNTKSPIRGILFLAIVLGGFLILATQSQAQVFDPAKGQVVATNPNPGSSSVPIVAAPDPIAEINAEIQAKQQHLDDLQQQADTYKQQIVSTQGSIQSLESEVTAVENQITLANIDLQAKQTQLDSLNLEIRSLQLSIDQKSNDINNKKVSLAETVRQLDASSRTTTLALVMQSGSFNDFYSQAQAQAEISSSLLGMIGTIKQARQELQTKQDDLSRTKDSVEQQKLQLQDQQLTIAEEKNHKEQLLSQTKKSAQQYQQLLNGSLSEVDEANAAIGQLQASLQSRINGGKAPAIDLPSPSGFIWPVPGRTINAYFLDANYNLGGRKHYGIDIDADQGTPVKSTADGVVVGIRPPDLSGAPSVLQIQNGGGFVTYYLHLHQIFVAQGQQIKQGDFLGYSGGQCGTSGAGTCGLYTTGAHLHYEMHLNNVPVDPLKYLP